MTIKSYTRKVLGTTAVVVAGITAGAGLANAAHIDTDCLAINGGHADFGNEPHWFGSPSCGNIVFTRDNSGAVTASVTGRTYLDNLAGSKARVRLEFLKADLTAIPGLPNVNGDVVSSPYSVLRTSNLWTRSGTSVLLAKVRVNTQILNNAGVWVNTGSKIAVMDDN